MADKKPTKASITIRVELSDLGEWTRLAGLRGLTISEWIRRRCNHWEGVHQPDGITVREAMREARKASKIVQRETTLAAQATKATDIAEEVLTTGRVISHDPRCTCLACKPEKKEKVSP